jgi:hypothetical protein
MKASQLLTLTMLISSALLSVAQNSVRVGRTDDGRAVACCRLHEKVPAKTDRGGETNLSRSTGVDCSRVSSVSMIFLACWIWSIRAARFTHRVISRYNCEIRPHPEEMSGPLIRQEIRSGKGISIQKRSRFFLLEVDDKGILRMKI